MLDSVGHVHQHVHSGKRPFTGEAGEGKGLAVPDLRWLRSMTRNTRRHEPEPDRYKVCYTVWGMARLRRRRRSCQAAKCVGKAHGAFAPTVTECDFVPQGIPICRKAEGRGTS